MGLTEPARLTVSDVRQRIFHASGGGPPGQGSVAGLLFHRTLEAALRESASAFWRASLPPDLDPEQWSLRLYDLALGPEIGRAQASLRESGAEALAVWNGLRSFARWFCGLIREAAAQNLVSYDSLQERWCGGEDLFRAELELSAALQEPDWPRQVVIAGRADQLIRVGPDRWCVVEFKLGAGHPEADAAQVCLYHELLGARGSAALVHFTGTDEPRQIVLAPDDIGRERPALMALIASLAGIGRRAGTSGGWPKPARENDLEMGKQLVSALREFGADSKLVSDALVGPTFVRYPLEPARGVSASKLEKQGSNLQMRLRLDREPMIGRERGQLVVDIQRSDREYVPFGSVMPPRDPAPDGGDTRVLAGVDLFGEAHFIDLAKDSPHILVGGVPGSGKSEWLRCAVASLVARNTPDTLRLVLIDPKKNAFTGLEDCEYLWRPDALVDSIDGSVAPVLEDLVAELESRCDLLKRMRADDLSSCARQPGAPPRIVCVVDEFADLLMAGKKALREEIERLFIRIAQKGRAPGVHLILATQRPERQVVSGLLKANIPAKIALQVTNSLNSRV